MKKYSILFAMFFLISGSSTNAQLTGIKLIDNSGAGDYISFTDAINDLNTQGAGTGGVVFNVTAGQTFTENPPAITASGNQNDPIIFQKSGSGNNPVIVPANPGVRIALNFGGFGDFIIAIDGGDYITFNGIDVMENPSFTTRIDKREYGYVLTKSNDNGACKNVTIFNCSIMLNKTTEWSGGIIISNSNLSGQGFFVDTVSERTENIKVFSNDISNVNNGIILFGYFDQSPTHDFYDHNIEIGVDGGNTITNFGGTAIDAYGIYAVHQDKLKIGNNTINGGEASVLSVTGIRLHESIESDVEVFANQISLQAADGGNHNIFGIENSGVTGNLKIYENELFNTSVSRSKLSPIRTSGKTKNLEIYKNTIHNNYNGALLNAIDVSTEADSFKIYGNNIYDNFSPTVSGITVVPAAIAGSFGNIFNNRIYNLIATTSQSSVRGIEISNGVVTQYNIYNNFISNLKAPESGSKNSFGIYILGGSAIKIYYNSVFLQDTSFSSGSYGIDALNIHTVPNVEIINNLFVNKSEPTGNPDSRISVHTRRGMDLSSFSTNSDYNIYYIDTIMTTKRAIFADFTNVYATFDSYAQHVSPREMNSDTANVPFIDPWIGDLHLPDSLVTDTVYWAMPLPGYDTDIDGEPRDTVNPFKGADELMRISTGIELEQLPSSFSLFQNYPNPFNPATNIGFRISEFGFVQLKIYDVLGNEVAALVNEEKFPGEYKVIFNASGLSSGVYFYVIKTGSFFETKKMILLK